MVDLQQKGCHNINFVTPTHMIYPILKSLEIAIAMRESHRRKERIYLPLEDRELAMISGA